MRFFGRYIKEHAGLLGVLALCGGILCAGFGLYRLPMAAVAYPLALCAGVLAVYGLFRFRQARRKHWALTQLQRLPTGLLEALEDWLGWQDEDYQALLRLLDERELVQQAASSARMADMLDYYTTWVHQIKTPIASMRLTLQGADDPAARRLLEDLFRIEQYVEMVLTYLRLDSADTDYVFRSAALDPLVKSCLRKFAAQFIGKGIRLDYAGTDERVVTDEKWLAFVLEQVISNALKYTREGCISVYMENDCLCVSDTGIGIAPEDLPRIFEKGYTGENGRLDRRASGLGLYLCRRICKNLGHGITAESTVGVGTVIRIDLRQDGGRKE